MRTRLPSLVAALTLGLVLGVWPNHSAFAVVTVTPSTDLVDGQTIAVSSTRSGGLAEAVSQCGADLEAGSCDPDTVELATFSSVQSMNVQRFIQVDSGLIDCAVEACAAVYETYDVGGTLPVGQPVLTSRESTALSFVPTRAVSIRADSHVTPGAIDIAASGLTAPVGVGAFAMLCAGVDRTIVCGSVGTIDADFNGYFSGQLDLRSPIVDGNTVVDCSATACVAVVVVLSAPGGSVVVHDVIVAPLK